MERALWRGHYGEGTMERALWRGHYGEGTMERALWRGHYGEGTMRIRAPKLTNQIALFDTAMF